MSKKYKKHAQEKCICVKKAIYTDEYLRKFILDNSFMRNKISNDFREEAEKYKGDYNMYYGFDPRKFYKEYYNKIELPENRYNYYCVGLSDQITNDISTALKTIRTKNKKVFNKSSNSKLGEFHFKKFDYNKYSFRVRLKPTVTDGKFYTRISIPDVSTINFRVRSSQYKRPEEYIKIFLKEPLYDDVVLNDNPLFTKYYTSNGYTNGYSFLLSDIKDISFMYECGNYYILLFINVSYNINKKSLKYSKDKVCGIDTGIRHPITIYDGNKTMYLSMDDKTTRKIHYLERRIRRLEHHRSLKYNANIERTGYKYSNNTIKLTKKIRRLYRKITNIKKFWIQNRCKEIATTYSKICVDSFEQPENGEDVQKKISKKALRKINYANRFHKMYYFNEFLKHDCIKYGCEYIESPEDTTRTCSICGYVNEHLKLSDVCLDCANCHNPIERDMNAARNCYDYLIDNT